MKVMSEEVKRCYETIEMINSGIGDITDYTRILEGFNVRSNAIEWTMGRLIVRIIDSFEKGKDGRRYILNNTSLNKSALSKKETAVRFCLEKGISFDDNLTAFEPYKVYEIASNPTNFIKYIDKGRFNELMQFSRDDLNAVAKGEKTLYNRNGLQIKDIGKKDEDSKKEDNNKKADNTALVKVTDENGIVYAIPADVLAKYKVEE